MIKKIDHIVITTSDIEKCFSFYKKLGFKTKMSNGRYELFVGDFKINVHLINEELLPHAKNIRVGSVDICFELDTDIDTFKKILVENGIEIELDIVPRIGTKGNMESLYIRDFDGNLIEFCSYI